MVTIFDKVKMVLLENSMLHADFMDSELRNTGFAGFVLHKRGKNLTMLEYLFCIRF